MMITQKISWQIGTAIIAGVPALVFVSIGQIASLTGNAAILVWIVSAAIGLVMAFAFAELARSFPAVPGGIGILGAYALRRRRFAPSLSRWSYWLGWSPGLAAFSVVFGNYAAALLGREKSPGTVLLLSLLVIVASTAINACGLARGAVVQVGLGISMLALLLFFSGVPVVSGQFSMARLLPLAPPDGWLSWKGLTGIGGALFLAGWTTYGAELAITMAGEYRRGTRDTVTCLVVVAIVTFAVYAIVPALITGAVGLEAVRGDPAAALLALVPASVTAFGKALVFAAIFVSIFLTINMIAVTSSRLLYQIARDEPGFAFLGGLNRFGVPGNAMIFDMVANCALLVLMFALSGGRTAELPLALLCAANVGYFVTIVLALAGAGAACPRATNGRRPLCCTTPVLVTVGSLNVLLLACAGMAWGWKNVGLGWTVLAALMIVTKAMGYQLGRRALATSRSSP